MEHKICLFFLSVKSDIVVIASERFIVNISYFAVRFRVIALFRGGRCV
ncbi:hypothetical protein PHOSAC3_120685 [Mesotoga infera]|nr:hypothetical protein PHOSAC3_120685 [Mesotoga infera]